MQLAECTRIAPGGRQILPEGSVQKKSPERPNSPGESFAVNFFHYVKWPGEHNKGR